ncbi:aminoacyl-tRNA hydrolase [Candidatus Peregrinibacteria bacterium HGW-Peregrinibacteria-1]|jgi:PTH1 family peptidyl-tRNA hydrolase|nr:MAG: aminoacyl-tRNA hydrolase [Candidatus Peregrinibacteria bacterium HGW-Peregrinibacteria-1]
MKILIGLGNPGPEYQLTRHNVGFMFLDFMLEKLQITPEWKFEKKFKAWIQNITLGDTPLLLVKPKTYMNLSGHAANSVVAFYKTEPADTIIVFDDIDLPLGTIRIKNSGTAGTHNGMKSIIQELGSTAFPRLKIGIESRGIHAPEKQDLSSFVLHNFTPPELQELEAIFNEAFTKLQEHITLA